MLTLIALMVICVGQLLLCTLLLFEGRRTKRIDQVTFGIFSVVAVLWTVVVGYLSQLDTLGNAQNLHLFSMTNKVAFCLSFLLLTILYLFSFYYPQRRPFSRSAMAVFGSGIILALASPLPAISGSMDIDASGRIEFFYGPLVVSLVLYVVVVLTSIFVSQYRVLRLTHDHQLRRQAKTLLFGIIITVLDAVIFALVLPLFLGQQSLLYALGYAAPSFLIAFVSYGLLKQGLFNISLIIARSIAYALLFTAVAVLYVLPAVLLSTYLLETPLEVKAVVTLSIVTLIVAVSFRPLKVYFDRVTNKLFYRDYYDAQAVFDNLSNLLVGTIDVERILNGTKQIIEGSVRPSFVTFLLEDYGSPRSSLLQALGHMQVEKIMTIDEIAAAGHPSATKSLRKKGVYLVAKLRTPHDDLGFILLGDRKSGEAYTGGDLRVLSVIADQLALSVQNALRFQEIEHFNVTLQQRVEEATAQLRRTNEKLRQLDQTKDDFISMASHQLRTPLTSVKGYVSMVLDGDAGPVSPLQRKLLNQSYISSQRMVYLISDLLNVSRLRTGKFIIEPMPCNLAKVINEEIDQLTETAKGRNLELTFEKPHNFPTLMLDETKIRQVIMNFIDNAIYYTPSGGHIAVNLVDKKDSVEFTVVDDGIGVAKHEQPHLFTKFYRAHNAKRARPDGTGLGLFMAKKVIVAQGGAIIFKSQEGKGSTFGFTFAKSKLQPSAAPATSGTAPAKA